MYLVKSLLNDSNSNSNSRIDIGQGINVGLGKAGKQINVELPK